MFIPVCIRATSSSAMTNRPRDACCSTVINDFKGVGHFEAKFYFEALRFAPISMDRLIGEWLYYNFAAGNWRKKKLRSRLFHWNWISSKTKKKTLFEPPFKGLRVTYAHHLTHWKARGRIPIRHNWTFSPSLNLISDGRGIAHQPLLVTETLEWYCPFV